MMIRIEEFPDCQWDALIGDRVDIDIEAKMKNLAIDGVVELVESEAAE